MNKYVPFAFLIIIIVVISGCTVWQEPPVVNPPVSSFEECMTAGYPVMESYPRQCSTPDGQTFTEIGMANPASTYCELIGGTSIFITNSEGTAGYCKLSIEQLCEEWNLYISEGEKCVQPTEEQFLDAAKYYVETSPTYQFDGMNLEHVETQEVECNHCWIFIFKFTSTNSGYGDRTGQDVDGILTEHRAVITYMHGEIISAKLDSAWDMVAQGGY